MGWSNHFLSISCILFFCLNLYWFCVNMWVYVCLSECVLRDYMFIYCMFFSLCMCDLVSIKVISNIFVVIGENVCLSLCMNIILTSEFVFFINLCSEYYFYFLLYVCNYLWFWLSLIDAKKYNNMWINDAV